MFKGCLPAIPVLAILAGAALSSGTVMPALASARSVQLQGVEVVNVSVGFNTQVPLPDLREDTLAESQKAGRKFVYRMARDECAVLTATIAETCRLANLSVNIQVQQPNQGPILLYINGNANFAISLKDSNVE